MPALLSPIGVAARNLFPRFKMQDTPADSFWGVTGEFIMHGYRHNDLSDKLPPAVGGIPRRPGLRFSTPPAASANWGFLVPVLIVFSVLWFLLSGTRAF